MNTVELPPRTRITVLVSAFLALVFDGVELGLMPVASLSVSKSLLGGAFTPRTYPKTFSASKMEQARWSSPWNRAVERSQRMQSLR